MDELITIRKSDLVNVTTASIIVVIEKIQEENMEDKWRLEFKECMEKSIDELIKNGTIKIINPN